MAIVAAFHLGIRGEDIVEEGLGGHGSGSGKVRTDDAAGVAHFVAGEAGGEEGAAIFGVSLLVRKDVEFREFFAGCFGCLWCDEGGGIVGELDRGLATEFEILRVTGESVNEGLWNLFGVFGLEIGADFIGSSLAIPDAIFADLEGRSFPGVRLSDLKIDEVVFKGAGLVGVENTIEEEFEVPALVTRDGAVGPEAWDHGAGGDGEVSDGGTAVNAEGSAVEVDIGTAFPAAEEGIVVVDSGREFDPGFDGEGAL